MQFLERIPGIKEKVEVIVNRAGLEANEISLYKALETIGHAVFWQLPNDYATMVGARNNGLPLCQFAPKARLTRSLNDMVLVQQHNKPSSKSQDETQE